MIDIFKNSDKYSEKAQVYQCIIPMKTKQKVEILEELYKGYFSQY